MFAEAGYSEVIIDDDNDPRICKKHVSIWRTVLAPR